MLNFSANIQQYTTAQARTSNTQFFSFTSKKQLVNANILSSDALQFVQSIVNVFAIAIHKDMQYAAITLYYANTKSYAFIVVDMLNKQIAQAQSIKQAKSEILNLVNANK